METYKLELSKREVESIGEGRWQSQLPKKQVLAGLIVWGVAIIVVISATKGLPIITQNAIVMPVMLVGVLFWGLLMWRSSKAGQRFYEEIAKKQGGTN